MNALSDLERWILTTYGCLIALNGHRGERAMLSMFCLKDDDHEITWDSEAMARGPRLPLRQEA